MKIKNFAYARKKGIGSNTPFTLGTVLRNCSGTVLRHLTVPAGPRTDNCCKDTGSYDDVRYAHYLGNVHRFELPPTSLQESE